MKTKNLPKRWVSDNYTAPTWSKWRSEFDYALPPEHVFFCEQYILISSWFPPKFLREALLTFVGAAKLGFPFSFVGKIIGFCREYMNPRHVLLSTETLKSWFWRLQKKHRIAPGRNSPFAPGRNSPFAPGRNSPFAPGRNSPFAPGRNSPFAPGRNSPFAPGRNSPFAPAAIALSRPAAIAKMIFIVTNVLC